MAGGSGRNFFELFGLSETFDLDASQLAARYRELQRQVHPDRFAAGSDQERRLSMQMTALINEAYATLKDPLARGRYLLGLRGVETDIETDTRVDTGFLEQQMELREALDAARDDPARLAALAADVSALVAGKTAELARQLAADDDAARMAARDVVREMQFLVKLRDEIEALEEAFI